jgi:HEAT repeat protein
MPQSNPTQTRPDAAALDAAFEALKTYDQGSSRGALMPIDEAVMASLDDKAVQKELEQRLASALQHGGSAVAREYLCSKLTLIGSKVCVPALAAQLATPEYGTALRDHLARTEGVPKIGVIHSLGARRDAESVRALTALLKHGDTGVVGAATAALGDIATTNAAKALREFQPKAPEELRLRVGDAILTCAERLLEAGKRAEAQTLYQLLATVSQPKHIQHATARGLELASGKP